MQFDYEKATQALNYLAKLGGGQINKMKALKLIWLAERFHLRKYGRLILNDEYLAMDFGPVASSTKDIAQLQKDYLSANEYDYACRYIQSTSGKRDIKSIDNPDLDVFSDSETEALDEVFKNFGKYNQYKLAEFSHEYPEWKKHESMLKTGNISRVDMNYDDFFENPQSIKNDFFSEDKIQLQTAKSVFQETNAVENALK